MKQTEKAGTIIGAAALLGLLLIAGLSLSQENKNGITGAVAGKSAIYRMCIEDYGTDIYGNWEWETIYHCRQYYTSIEKGGNAAKPRLCLSSPERIECQDE